MKQRFEIPLKITSKDWGLNKIFVLKIKSI